MLRICFILSYFAVGFGVKDLTTNYDYENFRGIDHPYAIFYYHKENFEEPLKSKIGHIMIAAEDMMVNHDNLFIKLATVNCKGENINMDKIPECFGIKRTFHAYKKGKSEHFVLSTLYDLEAFLGHMLSFVYDNEIGISQNQNDWDYEQNEVKGEKDIVLAYFLGLGTKEHYHFINYASKHLGEYKFVYSTEKDFAVNLGMPRGDEAALWYVTCSQLDRNSDKQCTKIKYPGKKFDTSGITSFITTSNLPLIDELNIDGTTNYKDIHRLFVFYDNEQNKSDLLSVLKNAINVLGENDIHIRGVLIDRNKHAEHMSGYGIYEDTRLPTILLELNDVRHSIRRELETFTPDEDINKENIIAFVSRYLSNGKDAYNAAASKYDIQKIRPTDWSKRNDTDHKIVLGGCSSDSQLKKMCSYFDNHYRHFVRTLFEADVIDVHFLYVDFTGAEFIPEFNKLPLLLFKSAGAEDVLKLNEEEYTYENMLQWINKVFGSKIRPIPSSGSDFVPLQINSGIRENEEVISLDGSLMTMEDDELAKDAIRFRNAEFYEDAVPMVTDRTLNQTISTSEMLVIYIYVPWDDRSYLFQPVYASIRNKLAVDSVGSTVNTSLVKLNCYTQHLACVDLNVDHYPVIRFFMNGKHLADYSGLLDEKSLITAIRLYQNPALVKLSHHEISAYTKGRHPMPAAVYVHVSFLACFDDEHNQDFLAYKSFAEKHHGKVLFSYAIGEESKEKLKTMDLNIGLHAFTRENDLTHRTSFNGTFNDKDLYQFFLLALSPAFGEITVSNFLSYKSLGRPLLLLFTKPEDRFSCNEYKLLTKIINNLKPDIHPSWMNAELPVTKNIRRSYVGKPKGTNDIVIVDYEKGKSYAFIQHPKDSINDLEIILSQWIKNFTQRKLQATSYLNHRLWKPLREGFDFLKYLDKGTPQVDRHYYNEEEGATLYNGHQSDMISFHGHKLSNHDSINKDDVNRVSEINEDKKNPYAYEETQPISLSKEEL